MNVSDPRGVRLRALDASLLELLDDRSDSPSSVNDEGEALCELAKAIADSMSAWNEIMPRLRLMRSSRFETAVAGGLAIETVFDGLLDRPSLGVLIAAFDLTETPR